MAVDTENLIQHHTKYKEIHGEDEIDIKRKEKREENPKHTKWVKNNPEKVRQYKRKYRENNREKINEASRLRHKNNPETGRRASREWAQNNPEKRRISRAKWIKNNPEHALKLKRRGNAKHKRSMGFVPLNKKFNGSVGHHIDKQHIVYIPKELHMSVIHNQNNKESMEKINELALNYLMTRGV